MRKALLFLSLIVQFLPGCRQEDNLSQLKEINDSLEKANLIIEDNNKMVYENARSKLLDLRTGKPGE